MIDIALIMSGVPSRRFDLARAPIAPRGRAKLAREYGVLPAGRCPTFAGALQCTGA